MNATTYLSEVNNTVEKATEVRSDLNIVGQFLSLLWSIKSSKPKIIDSLPAVVGGLAYGTDHCGKVCGVQLYESGINVIVQSPSIAFGNFYHTWVSVFMDHSDLDLACIIILI